MLTDPQQRRRRRLSIPNLLFLALLMSLPVRGIDPASVNDISIADESLTSDWLAYGRTHNERRFSPLTDINVETVSRLGVDWYLDLPNDVGLVSTPLVVDGTLYFNGTMNVVRAVDATSGKLIWEYDPEVGR